MHQQHDFLPEIYEKREIAFEKYETNNYSTESEVAMVPKKET
jgi:hypothetical protein